MKYRILSNEELSHLEEDFKHFLIVNGVHTEEWKRLNKEEIQKAVDLVEIFSDTVLQKVYEKLEYLEFRSEDSCMVFHFDTEKVELISIHRKTDSSINLSTAEGIHVALVTQINALNFFQAEKKFSDSREKEIHRMLEQGCLISSSEFWNSLKEIIQ